MWLDILNEGTTLFLLIALGLVLYRGLNKNQTLLAEREDLLKRYLLFRGDKQVRLKIHGEDEKTYLDLLKNLSNSWKNFKKAYDQCVDSFVQNTHRTKLTLQIITLVLVLNSARLFFQEYFFYGSKAHFFYTLIKELTGYVLVVLGFSMLRTQTYRYLSLKGEALKMDRDILFYPDRLSDEGDREGIYDEFDPLQGKGAAIEQEDQAPHP
ncbi:MAG: hypothetical protein A2W09_02475 [Deltaproteobacteria bacterium RBG_16_50_11]|nr:MAG: hypothetical protein A2W09_02475 [Deltaproteobacteria bacterium RBG_16_50_11]